MVAGSTPAAGTTFFLKLPPSLRSLSNLAYAASIFQKAWFLKNAHFILSSRFARISVTDLTKLGLIIGGMIFRRGKTMKIWRNNGLILALGGFVLAGLVVPNFAKAETKPAPIARPAPKPALDLRAHIAQNRENNIENSLEIKSLAISINISGGMVETTLNMDFANPTAQTLEGDFTLDLPIGARLIAYGLDVHGVMTDGVLQPKLRAQEAYENNLRRGVDPGLAEINNANQFRTHIFPIFPNQGRKVKITYVTPIGADGKFELPLTTANKVGAVAIAIKSDRSNSIAVTAPRGLTASQDGNSNYAYAGTNLNLVGALSINNLGQDNKLSLSRHSNGEKFFDISFAADSRAASNPKTIRIFWDASLSRKDDNTQKEANVVADYIDATKPESLDLILFSDGEPRIVHFANPNKAAVLAALNGVQYIGASRFNGLERIGAGRADVCLLVSDGQFTLGQFNIRHWPCKLNSISASANLRSDVLSGLAARNGGEFIDLRTTSPQDGLTRLLARGPQIWGIETEAGEEVDYLINQIGANQYRIIGPKPDAQKLILNINNEKKEFDIANMPTFENDGAGSFWGASQIERLSATDNPNDEALQALVRRYHVATPDYSFIVLETGRDYAINHFEPPRTIAKEIWDEYVRSRDELQRADAQARDARFNQILSMWNEQKQWYNQRFPTLAELFKNRREGETITVTANSSEESGRVYAPSAPPPPPPPPSAPSPSYEPATAERATGAPARAQEQVAADAIASRPQAPETERDGDAANNRIASSTRPQIAITTAQWNPNRPYLEGFAQIRDGDTQAFEREFNRVQAENGNTPAFYFDIAEYMFRHGFKTQAAAMARNALELDSANLETKIILGSRLLRYKDFDNAIWLYENILNQNDIKPQSKRNLALAIVEATDFKYQNHQIDKNQAIANYRRALSLLKKIILTPTNNDYDGIETIALMEANHIIAKLHNLGVNEAALQQDLDPKLTALLDVDIRVVLEWNTDHTDMDLWVDEPSGERAIYSNPHTQLGGRLSNDMTQGYGPEEYLLHNAPNGDYKVLSNVYAADRIDPNGPISLTVHLYRDWGRPSEQVETFVIDAKKDQSSNGIEIGHFRKGPP